MMIGSQFLDELALALNLRRVSDGIGILDRNKEAWSNLHPSDPHATELLLLIAQWVDVGGPPDGETGERRRALTFVADPAHPLHAGRLPEAEVADTLARGVGPQGTAAAYLLDTAGALRREEMPDPLLERLAEAVGARLAEG